MKRKFSILIVGSVIVGLVFSLVEMAMVSQISLAKNIQSMYSQSVRPISATGMQVVKKTFLPLEFGGVMGRPSSPPGLDKNKKQDEGIATGVLGGPEEVGNKYAVIVGICDYPGDEYDLCDSDGDSLNMYKALNELYGYDDENIYLYRDESPRTEGFPTDGAATFNNIEGAILKLQGEVKEGDEVVFFFSGHGGWLLDENGLPDADGDEDDGKDEAIIVHNNGEIVGISDDTLVSWFSDFGTTRIIFIFDTCLAGGMNDLADAKSSDNGRIIVMATNETHSAYVYSTGVYDIDGDGINDGEGVFTHFFVNEGMLQGFADTYNHGIDDGNSQTLGEDVVVEEAFDYGKENIPSRLKRRQKPVIEDGFENDLLL